eukprot:comp72392_c0_seq1/m.48170 comp72392_c0_seq1/g.48170  ORF comp72392_c0_seq1/g.48170 comp72392_c0_seq1/m.48170 type:complete len:330 (-) comp72392_c0_seq1:613-1602(-)
MDPQADAFRQLREAGKAVRRAKKDGTPVIFVPEVVLPIELVTPESTKLAQERMQIFGAAYTENVSNVGHNPNKGEKAFTLLYEDMRKHEKVWFQIFSHDGNYMIIERCVGMLGTLATLHRQRGNLDFASEILELDGRVFKRYTDMTSRVKVREAKVCHDELKYKYDAICMNCLIDQYRRSGEQGGEESPLLKEAVSNLRVLIRHEIEYSYDFDKQNFAVILSMLHMSSVGLHTPSLSLLNRTTDTQLMGSLLAAYQLEKEKGIKDAPTGTGQPGSHRVTLSVCAKCSKQEPFLGEYKTCSGCKKVYYCGRECQKADWRTHKASCSYKAK